ncbi:HlyD family secretion protein [Pseudodesulfovibrio sp.]|uniref:HlyD family secretion protein n=1 Tax=Pseudodesulfovibrio sp. TaxID=2035812 RepID=UPI00262B42BF|nr:HlyD family secretion protein [Pseudodesulfovibrio sp.]MDD3313043.1 HlyD family secretion protein [Pseudodesulfovibrio sp.]
MYLFAAGVFLAGLAAGYPVYQRIMTHESTDDAFVEAQVVSISPRVAGHIAKVLVADNQRVEKGELLAEVDRRDFEVALEIAEAKRQAAVASLDEGRARVAAARNKMAQQGASLSSVEAELAQARAGVAEVKAGTDRDESDLERMRRIADAGAVSRQEFDHAKAQADMSRAKLNSAKRQVDTQAARIAQARASVGTAGDELRQAEALAQIRAADLREAEAEVERARLNLSYSRITAPCAGYVTKKAVEPGAYVQVGQKLFALVSRDVWVVANFKETQIAGMRPGQPVEIEVDAYPSVTFRGRVDSIQRGTGSRFTLLPPENATGNFVKVVQRVPVKIVLDGENGGVANGPLLVPGMSVVPSVNVAAPAVYGLLSARSPAPRKTTLQ